MRRFRMSAKKQVVIFGLLLICFILSTNIITKYLIPDNTTVRISSMPEMSYNDYDVEFRDGKINTIYYTANSEYVFVQDADGLKKMRNLVGDDFEQKVFKKGITLKPVAELATAESVEQKRKANYNLYCFAFWAFYITVILVCWSKRKEEYNELFEEVGNKLHIYRVKADASTPANTHVKSGTIKDSSVEVPDKTFDDIAGLYEVKKDIKCVVDFVKNKDKYIEAGAKLPKGIILYGPPGTGKTLLAKAIAGEAGIPFLYASGSDFTEMYVGVGPKRVRELFSKARRQAPCIIFIDEIDAFGSRRGDGEHSEDRKTINALLTEMDGFSELDDVIVIGATNRLEDLDSALTRPGRFTDKYCVPLPESIKERLEIIDLYIQDKKLGEDVSLERIAKETVGFSPAQIEALLNESAIISVQDGEPCITKAVIDKAMYKILLNGHQKENPDRRKEEINVVAWHEAGHALVGKLFGKEITKVTITQSTSGAGGVTFSLPEKTHLLSMDDMRHEVMELYAGRIGEYLYYNENNQKITTGASNDIERATSIIRDCVAKYGMSKDIGMLNLDVCKVDKNVLLDKLSEIARDLESATIDMMKMHYNELKLIAESLIENETIYDKDLDEIIKVA